VSSVRDRFGSKNVTTANGVLARSPTGQARPSALTWKKSPSSAIISPSSASSVPSPKSPRPASSAKLTSPSYFPSSKASTVEV
jgi:hypothetical protein